MRKFFKSSDDFFYIIKTRLEGAKKIRLISTGWTNFVFEVRTRKGKFIFRFPRNDFFADALTKECEFLQSIDRKKLSFSLPNLQLYFYKNRPYSVHKALAGKPLSECAAKKLNKKKLAEQVCKFMKEINEIITLLPLPTTSQFLAELSRVSGTAGEYDLSRHEPLVRLENEQQLVVCHGDLNPGNILIKRGRMVAVLDYAFVSFCSPLDDLARLLSRAEKSLWQPLVRQFEESFGVKVEVQQLQELIGVWDYVEEKYVAYIREFHPDIVLPEKFS